MPGRAGSSTRTRVGHKIAALRMMFSCCQPRLSEQAQVVLVLHILCGFGVDEIASAFVTTHATTEKWITRAKKVLAGSRRFANITAPADFSARLPAVHRALYLLFNEGDHGASAETAVQVELCREAMRPATYALAALLFHAALREGLTGAWLLAGIIRRVVPSMA